MYRLSGHQHTSATADRCRCCFCGFCPCWPRTAAQSNLCEQVLLGSSMRAAPHSPWWGVLVLLLLSTPLGAQEQLQQQQLPLQQQQQPLQQQQPSAVPEVIGSTVSINTPGLVDAGGTLPIQGSQDSSTSNTMGVPFVPARRNKCPSGCVSNRAKGAQCKCVTQSSRRSQSTPSKLGLS